MANQLLFTLAREFNTNGTVAAGATATFYAEGTTTLVTVYSDAALTTAHPNPLTASAGGLFADVYTGSSGVKVVTKTSAGTTLRTLDPCPVTATSTTGASGITFDPTAELPYTNVQDAIEGSVTVSAADYANYGLGVTGTNVLLANIDATGTASGTYRYDTTTTGTYPTGITAANEGIIVIARKNAATARMWLYQSNGNRAFMRRMETSSWNTWREVVTVAVPISSGDMFYMNATNSIVSLAKGTAGQAMIMDSASAFPSWGSPTTLGTSVASTSGTTISFTSIPSWVTEITMMGVGVSTNGSANVAVRLGTSSGVVTSGYAGSNVTNAFSTSFILDAGTVSGTSTRDFTVVLRKVTGNQWLATLSLGYSSSTNAYLGVGDITLAAALDRVQFLTANGTDTFDAGVVNISYR